MRAVWSLNVYGAQSFSQGCFHSEYPVTIAGHVPVSPLKQRTRLNIVPHELKFPQFYEINSTGSLQRTRNGRKYIAVQEVESERWGLLTDLIFWIPTLFRDTIHWLLPIIYHIADMEASGIPDFRQVCVSSISKMPHYRFVQIQATCSYFESTAGSLCLQEYITGMDGRKSTSWRPTDHGILYQQNVASAG